MSTALLELMRRAAGPRGSIAAYVERRASAFDEDARWLRTRGKAAATVTWPSKLPKDWEARAQVAEAVAAELRQAVREIGAH